MRIEKVLNLDDLRKRIVAAVTSVTPDILLCTLAELDYRLDMRRATYGAHKWKHTKVPKEIMLPADLNMIFILVQPFLMSLCINAFQK